MPERRNAKESAELPLVIHPTAVYTRQQLTAVLGLRVNTLRRQVASGRLRVARVAGRYFFLGAWVLEWIEAGERTSRRRPRAVERQNGTPATEG